MTEKTSTHYSWFKNSTIQSMLDIIKLTANGIDMLVDAQQDKETAEKILKQVRGHLVKLIHRIDTQSTKSKRYPKDGDNPHSQPICSYYKVSKMETSEVIISEATAREYRNAGYDVELLDKPVV